MRTGQELPTFELSRGNLERRVEGMLDGVLQVLEGEIDTLIIDPQDDLGTTHRNKGVQVTPENAELVGVNIVSKFATVFPAHKVGIWKRVKYYI